MVEPVTRTHEDGLVPDSSLSAEGRLRRAESALWETRFATRGNTANPRIGSRAQHPCTVEEEKPSRW
jgi:hypothetical protein